MHTPQLTHPHPTTSEWSRFLSIVAEYRRTEPWIPLGYRTTLIAVENPLGGETAYCNIAPNLGFGVGLTIFLGEKGLRSLSTFLGATNLSDGTVEPVPFGSETHRMIRNTFEGISLTIAHDNIFFPENQYHRIPLTGEDKRTGLLRFVEVTRHTAGRTPCEPSGMELDFLGEVLQQLIETAGRVEREGEAFFEEESPETLWTLRPEIDPFTREIGWSGAWKAPEIPIHLPFDRPSEMGRTATESCSSGEMERYSGTAQELALWNGISKTLDTSDEVLLLVVTLEAIRVSPINAPPIRRRSLGAISVLDGGFMASVALEDPEIDPVEVRRGLLQIFQSREEIPHIIHVGDESLYGMLSSMSRSFGFILLHREMPDDIAVEISRYMEECVTYAADGKAEEGEFGITMKGEVTAGLPDRPPSDGLRRVMLPLEHFCSENFQATLYQEALDLAAWLDYTADPSPLLQGRPEVWACGIAWFIASEHRLWYQNGDQQISTEELCDWFGVKKNAAERRKGRIREMVGEIAGSS